MGKIDYIITLEIFESSCDLHKVGEKFRYPEDIGRLCPWLLDSVSSMAKVLQFGGTLPWKYSGTLYEKEISPETVTTEFVRCPDPTSAGVVVKITRTKLEHPREVGWS